MKKTGPLDSNFIKMAKTGINHDSRKIITNNENEMSNTRLNHLIIGLCSCVFLSERTGNNS